MTPYRVETERLVIRCYDPEDAPLLKDAVERSLEHLQRWMPWTPEAAESIDTVYERLREFRAQYDRDENWIMGVFSPDDSRCLGGTGLHPRQGEGGVEIGYWIAADETRRGYATELSAVLTRVGFACFGLDRIEIRVDPANEISERVPAKLGFTKEGTLRRRLPQKQGSELRDVNIWTMFRSELAGSPVEAYGYTAYDGLGRVIP
ncbi:MAG TPA: GNAT family protein [Gaiellaceae bacterium]|nr:GNAT family protein [Gaiellaceae bacterium]